jgi:hypothetical protein
MSKFNKLLPIALGLGFLTLAFLAFVNGQPQDRNHRVYQELKAYIPYKIEKKIGGLRIRNTKTDEKIEPKNSEVYKVLDNLEKDWGEKYLRLEDKTLIIVDDENKTIRSIDLKTPDELSYIHNFFGL